MQRLDAHLGQGRLRPWGEFFDTQRFKVPSTADVLLERTSTNLQYYAVNYALLSLAFLTCLVLLRPFVLVILGAEVAIVWCLYSVLKSGIVRIPTSSNSNAQVPRVYLLALSLAVTGTLLGVVADIYFLFFFSLSIVATLGHAMLRARSVQSKLSTFMHEKLPLGSKPPGAGLADAILSDVVTQVDAAADRASDEEARRRSAQVEHYTKVHDGLKQKYTGTGSGSGGHPK